MSDNDWRGISKREWMERAEAAESRLSVAEIGLHNQIVRSQELEKQLAELSAEMDAMRGNSGQQGGRR